jgi:hypothetical protein
MLRSRFVPTFLSASLIVAAACRDSVGPTSPVASNPKAPSAPALITLAGVVHLSGTKLNAVVLTTNDGQDIPLTGDGANALASVENAGVEVQGGWEGDGGFQVADFLVRTMGGSAVIDGTLIALNSVLVDLDEPIGYVIRPTKGGSDIVLTNPPAELLAHLNERLWVAGVDEGTSMSFGVIGTK